MAVRRVLGYSGTMDFLIYASTATQAFSEADLLALLNQSRKVNADLGITGLLLYSPGQGDSTGTFVQVLEGPASDVKTLYAKICRDPRHRDCTLIKQGPLYRRRFGEWTMGFRDLSTLKPEEVPGFNPIFLKNWTLKQVLAQPDPVLQLVYSFASV